MQCSHISSIIYLQLCQKQGKVEETFASPSPYRGKEYGTGIHQEYGTGIHQEYGTGIHQEYGTGIHQEYGTGIYKHLMGERG